MIKNVLVVIPTYNERENIEEMIKEINNKNEKQVLSNIEIKAGKIRLPELMTKISGFEEDEEIILVAENGKIEVKRVDIK